MDQHADYDTIHPYRTRFGIAPHLRRNVCLCREPSGLTREGRCKECGKLPVYFIYKCVNCDVEFLHDFVRNFCYKHPLCWDCGHCSIICKGHNYCVTWITEWYEQPPSTIMKPAFTDEDMEGVFDFLE